MSRGLIARYFFELIQNISKCITMLDNILYGFQTSMSSFTGLGGVEVLVKRIHSETMACLDFNVLLQRVDLVYPSSPDPGQSLVYRDLTSRQHY